jgi:hypothetical protein
MRAEDDIHPCLIFIDKEGHWFHKGMEMVHREFIHLFYRNMQMDDRGRCIIRLRGDVCYVDVEDTPFVVWRTRVREHDGYGRYVLFLSDDSEEELLPDTLYVGDENVLYCRVKERAFPARFSRSAYYQLAEYIEEESGRFFIPLNGERYMIAGT